MAKGSVMGSAMGAGGALMGKGQAPRPTGMSARKPGSPMAQMSNTGVAGGNLNDISGSLKEILKEWNQSPNQTMPSGQMPMGQSMSPGSNMFGPMMSGFPGMSGGNPFFMPNYYSNLGVAIPNGGQGRTGNPNDAQAIPIQTAQRPGAGFADTNQAMSHLNSQLTRGLNEDELGRLMGGIGLNRNYQGAISGDQMAKAMDLIRQNNPSLLRGTGV